MRLYDDYGPVPPGALPSARVRFQAEPGFAPRRAHDTDAGWDLRTTEKVTIPSGGAATIGTGVRVNLPRGHVGYLHARSSLGFKHSVQLANSTGVIDAGYTGEIKARLINHGDHRVTLQAGDRVVQLVIHRLPAVTLIEGDLDDTERGTGGFGSTGTH